MPVNTGWRDPRFGQFADPNFGASLDDQGAPGVLPSSGTPDMSASSASNNGVIPGMRDTMVPQTPSFQAPAAAAPSGNRGGSGGVIQGGPGLMPQQGGGPVYLADGGVIDDQDSGNATQASSTLDPMALLNWGRKAAGLPESFFGKAKPKSSNDPRATQQAMDDEGVTGQIQDPDINTFSKNQMLQNTPSDQTLRWGQDTDIPGQQKDAMYLADGGMIPDGNTDQEDQPDQDQMTPSGNGQPDPNKVMSYLKGEGAVPAEQAAALEQKVDPQGQMDPAQRKVAALSAAGSPQAGFGLMQHYRQKFNAYSAFAQAAIQGSGGRPPSGHSAADALTKAYDSIPDGKNVKFTPTRGGMRVTVGGNKAQHFANGGSVGALAYDEGGGVEGDDFNYETAGSQTPSGSSYDRAAQAAEAQQDTTGEGPVKEALGGRAPHEAIKDFVLSIPELLGWVKKDGQFDSVLEKGFENTVPQGGAAQAAPQGMEPGAAGTQSPGLNRPADPDFTMQRPAAQANKTNGAYNDANLGRASKPQDVGSKIGKEGALDPESTIREILHNVDQMFPYVGQNQQRLQARNAALTEWMKNRTTVEAGQNKTQSAQEIARLSAGAKERVAETGAGARIGAANIGLQGRALHEDAATGRNTATNANRAQIANTREDRVDDRFNRGEQGRDYRVNVQANPGLADEEARKRAGGRPQVPQRQAPQQGATQGDGPAPSTPPPAGMKYQVNTSGTKWRLVPAQ